MNDQNLTPQSTPRSPLRGSVPAAESISALAQINSPTLDDIIEILLIWSQETLGNQEIVTALEQFYQVAGKVFHDDSFYETRISYFFDYFLFKRPISDQRIKNPGNITPYEQLIQKLEQGVETLFPSTLIEPLQALGSYKHSIFQILKVADDSLKVQDLLTSTKYLIKSKAGETYRGFEKKDIFQSFIFPNGEVMNVSQGIVVHPPKASRVIKRQLKLSQKQADFSEDALLYRIARQQIRYLRHRHVDPRTIYQTEPR